MRALILGVGDAFTARSFGSSALIDGPGGYVLLDCPDLVHRALAEATARAGWEVDAGAVEDILLTHLHGDHCNGLESFGFRRRFSGVVERPRRTPRLHTSALAAQRLWDRLAPAMDGGGKRTLVDFFELHVLDPESPATVAGLTVRCRLTGHPIPTIGLLLGDAGGLLGWSSDTPFESAHVEWLDQADIIVHECNLGEAHTPIESLNALPDRVRRKMRLIHLPDDFDRTTTDIGVLEAGEVLIVQRP